MSALEISSFADERKGEEGEGNDKFSFLTTLAFSINFAMGAGFLTLPYAFYKSGLVLAMVCIVLIIVPLGLSIQLVLEAMARGSIVWEYEESRKSGEEGDDAALLGTKSNPSPTRHRFANSNEDGDYDHNKTGNGYKLNDSQELLLVGERKIELVDLAEIFMGRKGKLAFVSFVSLYNYGCLWLYTAIFSHAMVLNFPVFEDSYHSYVFFATVFGLLVVPCSCLDLTEQVKVQMALSLCRVIVIVIMVVTSLSAYLDHGGSPLDSASPTPAVNLTGFSTVLSICCYAFLFSQGLPVLAEPVRDKRQLGKIFLSTLLFMIVGYTSIGVTVSLLFGSNIHPSCNLLWGSYRMGNVSNPVLVFIARVVGTYVVLFPALDCLSAYPLMAIMLGNSLDVTFSTVSEAFDKKFLIFYRLLAAIPPILGAIVVSNPGAITNYTGISGIVIGFIFPPLFSISSEAYFVERKWSPKTYYSSGVATFVRRYILYLGLILCAFVLIMNIFFPLNFHESL